MNNHDENKKYFKSTFKVFHAPDNIAKEVLDMAKKLNQEDNTNSIKNSNQDMISYQVESVSRHHFGRWVAIASACVLIVGSGVYFNNLGSGNVSNQIEEDNSVSLGLSSQSTDDKLFGMFDMPSQVNAKLLAHSSENSDITSYLTSQDLTKLNPLINYENWIEVSTYPADFDNDVMYPYFAQLDFQTNDGEYIRLEIIDQYVLIYHTDENYEYYSNVEYYQYDFNNDITFFETFKQLLENNATQQVDTVQTPTNTDGRLIEYSPNVDTATAETIHCDGATIHVELSTDDLDSINSIIDSTIIWSKMSTQDYEEWTSQTYNDYIRIKVKHTNNNTETEYLIYQHCVIMLQDDNISISTTITGDQFGTILCMISNVPILNDVNYILNDLIPNSVAIIDENGTLTEYSATENHDLSEINDILQAQEWTVQPVQERSQENAIIFCTDYTYNQDDNNIFIESTSYAVLYQDGSLGIINDNYSGTLYSKNGSQLYNTIYGKLRNVQYVETKTLSNEDTSQKVATLFGVIEIPNNTDFTGSNMYGDISVNGYLNDDIIEKFNELSNVSEWIETDLSSIGDDINIVIDIGSTPSDRTFKTAYNFIIQDNVAMVTQNDGSQKCYIVPDTLAYDMITILNESNVENQVDNSKLFGIIPMDENTTMSAINNFYTGRKNACILNYQDLIKINELSCYDMWQQLTSNPISQNQGFEVNITLKNDNYSIQILDTTIIVTYPDGTVEYYSTMETCGTDTFAQRVKSLIYERSKTQIID